MSSISAGEFLMDFSSVSIDSCFFNLLGTLLLQESVWEAVDWGGEGRCPILFYHWIEQGKRACSLLVNVRWLCREDGHPPLLGFSPAAFHTKTSSGSQQKSHLLTSFRCPHVPVLLLMCSEKRSDLFSCVLFLFLDNQQEHLCVLGGYTQRWAANRECLLVL